MKGGNVKKRKILGIPVLVIVVLFALIAIGLLFRFAIAPMVGWVEKQEIVHQGEFIVYSYDHFFDLCKKIRTAEAVYDEQWDILQCMNPRDENYYKQQQIVAAQVQHIQELKETYNADSAKEGTRGQWKANCLPEKLSTEKYEYGRRTQCDTCN
jgi:hypothetical protein